MKKSKIEKLLSILLLTVSMITITNPVIANAAWKQNSTGWWFTEGSSYAKGWRQISGVWYYFDNNGYMKTGWVKDNNKWYYMDNSGAMKTGWIRISGEWYNLDNSGAMRIGWVKDSGGWYYLDDSGVMKTGWVKDSKGLWYYLKSTGKMASSEWVEINNKKYYFQEDGTMYGKGWLNVDNKVYMIDKDGAMCTGWQNDSYGNTYYFYANGVGARGIAYVDGADYYFNHQTNQLKRSINTSYISTDEDGKITRYDDSNMQDVIYANDSSYIESLKEKYGKLTFTAPEFTSLHYQFREYGNLYEMPSEEAKLIYVCADVKGNYSPVAYYLVGLETGTIYSVQDKMGSKVYEVKDNKIVKRYRDVLSLNNSDWR